MAADEPFHHARDVAFARAGADLLVEADAEGRILFVWGDAPPVTGAACADWIGRPLETLVDFAERDARALRDTPAARRFGPFSVCVAGLRRGAALRGAHAQDGSGRVFLAVTYDSPVQGVCEPAVAGGFARLLADGRLTYALQPIVSIATRAVTRYELLARFPDGREAHEGVLLAEDAGLAEALDGRVVARAVDALTQGEVDGEAGLSVNLSGASIVSDAFVDGLLEVLAPLGDARAALSFEITETTPIPDLARANAGIQRLRAAGHTVCLDDFGAGAASLPYLQALDVDGVKIDGGYVARAMASDRDAALLEGVAGVCAALGLPVIAERVETEAQAERLQAIGVPLGQGYLFGRPKPLDGRAHAA